MRLFRLKIILVLICVLLSSCSKYKQKVSLLLDWLPNPNHIPLFVGEEKGFFQEEGIDLSILQLVDPPSAIPYLESKQVDLVLYYTPYTLLALGRENNLRLVATLIQEPLDGVLYLPNVEERRLATFSGPFASFYTKSLAEKGVFFKETKKIEVDPLVALMTGLVEGVSGVYWNVEPILLNSLGKESSFIKVTDLGFPFYPELIIVTREDFLAAHPAFSSKFQRALQRSIDFCRAYPEEAFSLYLERYPTKKNKAFAWEYDSWKATLPVFSSNQVIQKETFLNMAHWMEERSLLKEGQADVLQFLEHF